MTDDRQCRNVTVSGRRTSLRMEADFWDSMREVCRREKLSMNDLCTLIDQRRGDAALTAAIRVFLLRYFRDAALNPAGDSAGKDTRSLAEIDKVLPTPHS